MTSEPPKAFGFSAVELLFAVSILAVVGAMAVPMTGNLLGAFRLSGDARSASNALALTKMRAASDFSQARLYVDLSVNRYHMETWQKTGTPGWIAESGSTPLASRDTFGYGIVSTPPPNTQATIALAPPCKTDAGADIANTACIVFNSRGVPVDSTGAPTAVDALYLTDNTAVYGVTISATGLVRLWRTQPQATPSWVLQ